MLPPSSPSSTPKAAIPLVEIRLTSDDRRPVILSGESSEQVVVDDGPTLFARTRICKSKYTYFHVVVYILTFACNMFLHASRKSFGNVKSVIIEEWTPSAPFIGGLNGTNQMMMKKQPSHLWEDHTFFSSSDDPACKRFLGILDTCFMVAYSAGLFVSGMIGDRYNVRYILFFGMIGNAVTVFMFACVGEWLQIYSSAWYITWWILNGFFESTEVPCLVAILGNCRGFLFGLWSTTSSVGNAVGTLLVARLLTYGYDVAMLVTATPLIAMAVIVLSGLVEHPADVRLPLPVESEEDDSKPDDKEVLVEEFETSSENHAGGILQSEQSAAIKPTLAIGFFEALCLPGVVFYSLTYATAKMVHYSFFFWLPFYLNRQFRWTPSSSDNLATWYDVGGIIGAIVGGLASDRLNRSPVLAVMLFLTIPALIIYENLPVSKVQNAVVLTLIGFCIAGAVNILSAAVAADLAKQPKLHAKKSALATVTGIMDGIGNLGAALGQILVPVIQSAFGWTAVFNSFIIFVCLSLICVSPMVFRELAPLWHRIRHFHHQNQTDHPSS